MSDETVDVAIVGAGVSGVYSAWRLRERFPERRIVVFEASERIGGRLLSVQAPGRGDMVAELGGMRILPAVQPRIKTLIDVLNRRLTGGDRIELYNFPVDEPQNIAFLRGRHLRLADFRQKPDKVPYALNFLERGMSAGDVIVNAIEQIVPGITRSQLTEEKRRHMIQGASFDGRLLRDQGFWNVLMRIISNEAFQLGVDAGGYNSTLTNWNAADAIPWYLSDFGVGSGYQGFRRGFQQVPLTLARLFKDLGGEVRLQTPTLGFQEMGDGYELTVDDKSKSANSRRTIFAKILILAMPRRSLDLITPGSPPLQQLADPIGSVTPRPLFKLFTTYDSPWWRAAGFYDGSKQVFVEAGRSVTDLPIRQTYYWPKDDGKPVETGPAMLLASYDDGTNVSFWDGLCEPQRETWRKGIEVDELHDPFGGKPSEPRQPGQWSYYQAPRPMVAEVARQLASIHGLHYTPDVCKAAYRDWGDDPYGGGWNSWNIGTKSFEFRDRMVQPLPDRPLHICGEAYSDAQGWVEGALQTADLMLDKLGIAHLI